VKEKLIKAIDKQKPDKTL